MADEPMSSAGPFPQDEPAGSPPPPSSWSGQAGPEVVMTQASGIDGASYKQQQNLVSSTMRKLYIRPPIGQTPLFQEQAIVPLSVTSISKFFDAARNEYVQAKMFGFRSIDWSVPFQISTQRILFHLWSRRFAISYVQFFSENKKTKELIDDYDFGSASSRLRMVRSFFAQQVAAWDVLIGNDSGKWLDRILIGAQAREGEELAQQFENFLIEVAKEEARGGETSPDSGPSLASTSRITQEEHAQLTERANSLVAKLQEAELKLAQVMFARIKHSINNMDLGFYMGPNQKLEDLTAEKEALQSQVDELLGSLKATGDEKDKEIASLSAMITENRAAFKRVKTELEELTEANRSSQSTFDTTAASLQAQVDVLTKASVALRKEAENLKKQAAFAIRFSVSDSTVPLVFGRNDDLDLVQSLREKINDLERRLEAVGKVKQEATQQAIQNLQARIRTLEDSEAVLLTTIEEKNTKIQGRKDKNKQLVEELDKLRSELEELRGSLDTDYVAISVYNALEASLSGMQTRLSSLEQFLVNTAQINPPLTSDQTQLEAVISKASNDLLKDQTELGNIKKAINEAAEGRTELMGFTDYAGAVRTLAEKEKQVCEASEAAKTQIRELEASILQMRTELEQKRRALAAKESASADLEQEKARLEQAATSAQEQLRTAREEFVQEKARLEQAAQEQLRTAREEFAKEKVDLQTKVNENKENNSVANAVREAKNMMQISGTAAQAFTKMRSALKELYDKRTQYGVAPAETDPDTIVGAVLANKTLSDQAVAYARFLQTERIRNSLGMPDQVLGQVLDLFATPTPSFRPIAATRA